jgi:hypothetical protein
MAGADPRKAGREAPIRRLSGRLLGMSALGVPFKVRRMASSAPIARRRAVSMTDRTSA